MNIVKIFYLFLIVYFISWGTVFGQSDFSKDYEVTNPITPNSCTFEEKVNIHQKFLDNAILNENSLHQLYGYLYLADDYTSIQDYSTTAKYLLEAERLALNADDIFWQGRVNHCRGVLYENLLDYDEALRYFELSLSQSTAVLDSQNMAKNLEQMACMFTFIDEFDKAHKYFEKAFPMIRKFCDSASLSVTFGNYATLLYYEGRFEESIEYEKQSLEIVRNLKSKYDEVLSMSNLANSYFSLKKNDESLALWEECVRINKENGWRENLIINYLNISDVYEQTKDFENSLKYHKEYFAVYDSVVGGDVKKRIADLEAKYENEKKELALQKYELELQRTQQSLERSVVGLVFMVIVVLVGIGLWQIQAKFAKLGLAKSQENLKVITQLLVQKNAQLEVLENKLLTNMKEKKQLSKKENFDEAFYNQRILTRSDWKLFKENFEKGYPGYIHRLRSSYPTISESEERLFLLLKLHLNTEEIADMLGISIGGVKKTRHRLRKRIEIEEGNSLEKYIQSF